MEVALKTKKTGRAWKAAKAKLPVAVRNSDIGHMQSFSEHDTIRLAPAIV